MTEAEDEPKSIGAPDRQEAKEPALPRNGSRSEDYYRGVEDCAAYVWDRLQALRTKETGGDGDLENGMRKFGEQICNLLVALDCRRKAEFASEFCLDL